MSSRALALPGAALVAVIAVLGIQLAAGGASYEPAKVASACVARPLGPKTDDLDQVTQQIVLDGVQRAACTVGTTRERLLLALPSAKDRAALVTAAGKSEADLEASLKQGMLASIDRHQAAGKLPKASAVLQQYGSQLGLPDLAVAAIKQVPDSMVDGFLPTAGVLKRAISGLDLNKLLTDLEQHPDALEAEMRSAITDAALAEARTQIQTQLPAQVKQFLGLG